MKHLLFLLLLLLVGGQVAAQNPCPLPPPASLTIFDIGPDHAKADWTLVSNASSYRVELIHVASNTTVSVGYYNVPGASFSGLATSTVYEVRISSSACSSTNQADYGDYIAETFETGAIIIGDIVYGFDPISSSVPPNTNDNIWACIPWIDPASATAANILHIRLEWGSTAYREFELVCQIVNNVPKLRIAEYNEDPNDDYAVDIINSGFQAEIKYQGVVRVLIGAPMLTNANGGSGRVAIQIMDDATTLRTDPLCTGVPLLYNETQYCSTPRGNGERYLYQDAPALRLTAAPNPFTDQITVRIQPTQEGPVELTLVNALGQTVRTRTFDPGYAQDNEVTLETADLAPGTYFLSVRTKTGRQTHILHKH